MGPHKSGPALAPHAIMGQKAGERADRIST
jgi:hypothetical protein